MCFAHSVPVRRSSEFREPGSIRLGTDDRYSSPIQIINNIRISDIPHRRTGTIHKPPVIHKDGNFFGCYKLYHDIKNFNIKRAYFVRFEACHFWFCWLNQERRNGTNILDGHSSWIWIGYTNNTNSSVDPNKPLKTSLLNRNKSNRHPCMSGVYQYSSKQGL